MKAFIGRYDFEKMIISYKQAFNAKEAEQMRGRPSLGKSSKQRISITIDPDLIEILKEKAEEDDRSLSQYINRVLRKMLMDKEKRDEGH